VSDGIKTITTRTVNINRGIFQGDALSALWFCICLNPLSVTLDNSKYGYKTGTVKTGTYKLNHLLYMDDLKLYANSKNNLDNLFAGTCNFHKSIAMELGLEKCKIINLERGCLVQSEGFYIDDNQAIQDLAENENYKYLQLKGLKHDDIKDKLLSQFKNCIDQILTTKLNSINIICAINTFAIPLLTYSFGIVKWNKTELEKLATVIRASLTKHRKHHPKSATEHIKTEPEKGGLGIINIRDLHATKINNLREYFYEKREQHQMFKVICNTDEDITPLNLFHEELEHIPESNQQELITTWKQKKLHGTCAHQLDQEHISKVESNLWLKQGSLHGENGWIHESNLRQ
jgi:hypothetical protein